MQGIFFPNRGHRCRLKEEVQSRFTAMPSSRRVSSTQVFVQECAPGTQVFTQVSETSAPLTLRAAAQGPQYAHWGVWAESRPLWVRGAGSWDAHSPRPLLCLPVPRVVVPLVPLLLWSPR